MENYTAQKSKSLKKQIESEINKAAREKELKKAGYVRQNQSLITPYNLEK